MQEKPRRDTTNLSDVLDRIMDKGIVIHAEMSFQLVGMVLSGDGSRIVVSSIETHLEYADLLVDAAPTSWQPVRAVAGTPADGAGRNRIGRLLHSATSRRDAG